MLHNPAFRRAQQYIDGIARRCDSCIEYLARFGFASKGVVYGTVGVVGLLAAFGLRGGTDYGGALREFSTQPFGPVLLVLLAIGLLGYALWRIVQALLDPEHPGKWRPHKRFIYLASGLVHGWLAYFAVKLALKLPEDRRDSDEAADYWTREVMSRPLGDWLVGLGGLALIAYGLFQIYFGARAIFRLKFKKHEMSVIADRVGTWAGQLGLFARGVVFCMIGGYLMYAAYRLDPSEARGLKGTFQALGEMQVGKWPLGLVAAGFIAYAVFMFVLARHRVIKPHLNA